MAEPMMVQGEVCESPAHLSPSSIGTWQQCPLRFRYSRLDRIPEPSTQAQILGSFVHEVLEYLYMEPAEERTQATARRLSAKLWGEKWEKEVEVLSLTDSELHKFRWQSWWCIETLWAMEDPAKVELAGVEQKLEMKVGDAKLLGILDRYNHDEDGRVVISDYKTGKKPIQRYEGEKRFQLTVYADLVQSTFNEPVSAAELLYLKEGIRWTIHPSEDDVLKMREVVMNVWSEIQTSCASGSFEARLSKLCNWCNYKSFCPAYKG